MAATVHTTIRLDTALDGDLPDSEWKVSVGGLEERYQPAMMVERSLTGAMMIHRLRENDLPKSFSGMRYTMFLTSAAEKEALSDLLGYVVYFMPHYRDEADVATYRSVMLFKSMTEVEPYDPMLGWWKAVIELEEATNNEVE